MVRWLPGRPGGRSEFDDRLVRVLPDLWRFASRLEREPNRAEDLVQDVAAQALDRAQDLRETGAFRTWMFRLVLRTFQNRRNQASARREQADDDVVHLATASGSPEQATSTAELGQRLERALDALPPALRDAVVLIDAQGLTLAEASDLLGIPQNTLATYVARARLALRNDLRDVALVHGVIR